MEKLAATTSTTSTQTAELQARIEKQIAEILAAGRDMLDASRLSKARAEWIHNAVSGKTSGIIQ
jgi:hypothetical protein